MARRSKPKTIRMFDQDVPVDEYGIMDLSNLKIPRIEVPEGLTILDLITYIPPSEEDKKRLRELDKDL